jgi:glycosyltransferase involved in cell wall biosynthesis
VAEDLRRDCPFLDPDRIHALPNAVDPGLLESRLLSREQARSELGLAWDDLVFANVGRYHPDKDQATLLRGFTRVAAVIPEARLLVIGDGLLRARLEELVSRLGLDARASIIGPIPEVSRYFAAFDAYVSSSDREPFGMVLAEAMAARLPIISTDCGGAPEVVGPDGLYFGSGDHNALAGLLRKVRDLSGAERRELGERLHLRLEREFSAAAFCRRFHALPPIRALFP